MMELTGEIPGLLRRSTPVVDRRRFYSDGEHAWQDKPPRGIWSPQGPKADEGLVLWDRSAGQRQRVEERVYAGNLLVDSEDATGRFHCREWLRDRGHDVGNEDRAEVLAWSVLSVWRGGKPLRGVMLPWESNGLPSMWMRRCERGAEVFTYLSGWRRGLGGCIVPAISYGPDAIKAEADAATLALGWALTNPDGTLTLPPLPGAK